jgi:hypothetical protein
MRRPTVILAALLTALVTAETRLHACGDKFLAIGRSDRYSRAYAAVHPGTLLLFVPGTSARGGGLADERLQKQLAAAGHRVMVARDRASLDRALQAEAIDVVMAGEQHALQLVPELARLPARPTLVAVLGDGGTSRAGGAAAAPVRLKASDKPNRFLVEIDSQMKARADAGLWRRVS